MFDRIVQVTSLFFFGVAVYLIAKEVEKVGFLHLIHLIASTPWWLLGIAFVFTFLDYIALSFYDILALDYVGKKIPYKTVFKTSSIGFAVSNTAGHAYASGGTIRYLFYTPCGLSKIEIVEIIAFEALTFLMGMGIAYLVSMGLTVFDPVLHTYPHRMILDISAWVTLIVFAAYYFFFVRRGRLFHISGTEIKTPDIKMTMKQLLVGFLDNFSVAVVFYAILRYHIDAAFLDVFIVFIIAQTIAITTQVPGGVGIFEGLFLYLFSHTPAEKIGILAALVVFRCLYFFTPFILALIYLAYYRIRKSYKGMHDRLLS